MLRRLSWIAGALVFVGMTGGLLGRAGFAATDKSGQHIYQENCQFCHGADGNGNPKMAQLLKTSIPPLTGAALQSKDDTELLRVIAAGKGKMRSFADKLTPQERQQVLEYIKTLGHE
jgi:mono/diheme cytochrome c family protein